MSYIHKALKKAQREKDSRYTVYSGVLPAERRKRNRFSGRLFLWIFFAVIISLLAFASYSWFDSKDQEPASTGKQMIAQPDPATVRRKKFPAMPPQKRPDKGPKFTDAKGMFAKARSFHKSGHLAEAKKWYLDAIKSDPSHVDALNNLGVLYIHDKDYKSAKDSFEKAIRLNPRSADPYYNLACVYAITGETKRSLGQLKRACSLEPAVKKWARNDADLKNLWGMQEFEAIIGTD